MLFSIKTKLSLSYILIIIICVTLILILANIVLESQFKNYVITQQEQNSERAVELISNRYQSFEGWDVEYIESVGMNALENGLILKIADLDDVVIWDATTHNNGLCQDMLASMSLNMQSRYAKWEGGYEEKYYEIKDSNGIILGTASTGYYGPYYFTDRDLYFINTINSLLIWVGIASMIIALFIGVVISRQISRPISSVINKARMIADGMYEGKIEEKSKTKEIKKLVDTVNSLADTLKKQQDLSRQLSSDISHELRTPLTTLQGNLEGIIDGIIGLDANRLNVMYDEVLRINRLVDDLGKLTQYESKGFHLAKEEFDLTKLIRNITDNFIAEAEKEHKKILFKGEKEIIVADKDKISQVIINMISNALKFTNANGQVNIEVIGSESETVIKIKDDGIGISDNDLQHIFERFYRADKSRNRITGGAGIGLAIVKSIINAHGGTIEAESKIGSGSEFIITLPKIIK